MKYLLLFLLFMAVPAFAAEFSTDCLNCHQQDAANRQLQQSAHAGLLSCADCHGEDHKSENVARRYVSAEVCGGCHEKQLEEHRNSRHGLGLHAGWGCTRSMPDRNKGECRFCHQKGDTLPISTVQCARFIKQSSEMGQIGCNRCHMIENSCGSCHGNHMTSAKIVQDPMVCAKCHMGPDHPQWEAWKTSQHGTMFNSLGAPSAPDCQSCHMPTGSHNISAGLTAPPSGQPYAAVKAAAQRQKMLDICQQCHARGFAARDLKNADAVRLQTLALVDEARRIIRDLDDRGLLDPPPQTRLAHPQRGQKLVLDGTMLYEDISHIESLFFRLSKYAAAKTFKGAFHQNPDYTHWYGNAEVKLLLNDIRGEASRLRERGSQKRTETAPSEAGLDEKALEVLQKRHERGELSDADYAEKKRQVLEQILQ
ncbi:MAG: SHOCT domain-containing protein [Geopsychrobacter sp.]|nr:SHOCT domain-containing protein [Geopsychrobacter sp.]